MVFLCFFSDIYNDGQNGRFESLTNYSKGSLAISNIDSGIETETKNLGVFTLKSRSISEQQFTLFCSLVELQWLEHLWYHENMLETGVVQADQEA